MVGLHETLPFMPAFVDIVKVLIANSAATVQLLVIGPVVKRLPDNVPLQPVTAVTWYPVSGVTVNVAVPREAIVWAVFGLMPPPGPDEGVTANVSIANEADMVMSALMLATLYDVTAPTEIETPLVGPTDTFAT